MQYHNRNGNVCEITEVKYWKTATSDSGTGNSFCSSPRHRWISQCGCFSDHSKLNLSCARASPSALHDLSKVLQHTANSSPDTFSLPVPSRESRLHRCDVEAVPGAVPAPHLHGTGRARGALHLPCAHHRGAPSARVFVHSYQRAE